MDAINSPDITEACLHAANEALDGMRWSIAAKTDGIFDTYTEVKHNDGLTERAKAKIYDALLKNVFDTLRHFFITPGGPPDQVPPDSSLATSAPSLRK